MSTYTITAVSNDVREKNLTHGLFKSYRMHLRDERGELVSNVEWFRKASSPAPRQGEQIEGEVQEGTYGPQFKPAQREGGGGSWKPRDPQERAEIRRQHAQSMALRYMELQQARGELADASWLRVADLTSMFFDDTGSVTA